MLRAMRSAALTLMAVGAGAMFGGCMGFTPYEEVLATQPADEFIQLDGQWVHFERAGVGETLVLIHGFGGSTYNWRKVMPLLAADFDVIALDLNGFGYTERPEDDAQYKLAGQVGLVKRLLDALGVDRATVVGHSYGAGVALGMATRYPERVTSVVLVGGGILREAAEGFPLLPPLRPVVSVFVQLFVLTEGTVRDLLYDAFADDTLVTEEDVQENLARLRVEGMNRALRGLTTQATDVLTLHPADIHQPVLLIWGREDRVVPISVGERLADELPDARLVVFEAIGHVPIEEIPAEVVAEIRDFFEDQSP
jgi:pimeloyl-ACP methyl ester carboxylesterase